MAIIEQLFDLLPDALVVVDEHGSVLSANSRAEQMFGFPPGGLAGMPIEDLMPAGMRHRHRKHRQEYMAHPRVRPMGAEGLALVGQRRGGEQFPVEISLGTLRDGDAIRYLASIRDISESQRVRQALVRAHYDALAARIGQVALASQDDAAVIERLPAELAGTLQVDAAAIVLMVGSRAEIAAQHGLEEAQAAALLDPARANSPLWRALGNGQPMVVEDAEHVTGLHDRRYPDATESTAVMPILDRGRAMGAIVVLANDGKRYDHDAMHLLQQVATLLAGLIQRRRTEDQLAHAQRLEAIGQLTGGVAHDFNNLLTVISGNLQLLEEMPGLTDDGKDCISSAQHSVTRAAELTAKLLAFARRQRLSPRAVEPERQLRELVAMLQRTLGDAIRLHLDCPQPIAAAYVDPGQLDTALVNLALNARDAMSGSGDITFSAREQVVAHRAPGTDIEPGRYIVFSVADTGSGMSPETVVRAIEPFFTTKASGTGLGLSMVYGFARQSGGYVQIDSSLGEGTRVSLFFPTTRRAVAADAARRPLPTAQSDGCVLVVEDEADVRTVAEAFLRTLGYRVLAAGNARDALVALQQHEDIALLFSDVRLGTGMDGHGLARIARALKPTLPVVLATGYDENGTAHTLPGPEVLVLHKPYRREDLAHAVQRALHAGGPAPAAEADRDEARHGHAAAAREASADG